jgi:hypothetical protein
MDFPGTVIAVRRLSAQLPGTPLKLVEDKANGPAVIRSPRIGGLVKVNPEGGKLSRVAGASPLLESAWNLASRRRSPTPARLDPNELEEIRSRLGSALEVHPISPRWSAQDG